MTSASTRRRRDPAVLKLVLAVGLLAVAISFLHAPDEAEMKLVNAEAMRAPAHTNPEACITARDGEQNRYVVKRKFEELVSGGHGVRFAGGGPETLNRVLSLVIFTVPADLVAGHLERALHPDCISDRRRGGASVALGNRPGDSRWGVPTPTVTVTAFPW
ncbi:MAG: hypothetical protein ACLFM6_08465 [Spirochaetaceae bacterium]